MESTIHISVKVLSGTDSSIGGGEAKTIDLTVTRWDKIESIKAQIEQLEPSLPTFKQLLLFAGQQLEDGRSLRHYDVKDSSVIFLVFKPTGK